MATTPVATTTTTHGKVHGATTTARAVPLQLSRAQALAEPAHAAQTQHEPNALSSRAQASHPRVPHACSPLQWPNLLPESNLLPRSSLLQRLSLFQAQPAPATKPAPATQPAPVAFQAAQIGPRLVQPSRLQIYGPTIKRGHFHHISLRI